MPQPLPRYQPDPDPNWHTRVITETGPPDPTIHRQGTAGGDNHQLRGIPAIGKGVTGAIPGTRPEDSIR